MVDTIYNRIVAKAKPEKVLSMQHTLSVQEQGQRYSLQLSRPALTSVFQIDGTVITSGERCDKLILVQVSTQCWTEIFVELKGKDVIHGLRQLQVTISNPLFTHTTVADRKARLVASAYPSHGSDPEVEKFKVQFKKSQCELKCLKSNQPDRIILPVPIQS
jgi:hypothetical protein